MGEIKKETLETNAPNSEKLGSFEEEYDIRKLGTEMISEFDSQGPSLEKDGVERVSGFNKIIGLVKAKFESLKQKFGLDEKLKKISEKAKALAAEAKAKIIEIMQTEEFGEIVDATPFVGGVKRVSESFAGKTLSGKELSGAQRLRHGTEGAVDFGTDLEGIGEVKKGQRLAHVGKKIASGIKNNPEALNNLKKKIFSKDTGKEI